MNICVRRAEEVSEETDEGQQYPAEVADHVRHGGGPEEDVRAAVKRPLWLDYDNDYSTRTL